MDVARDASALLGDGSAELGLADRPPDADEEHGEGEDPEQVALEDVVARAGGCEHVVEVGEHDEREGERQPAVEVAPVAAVAQAEADDGDERERWSEVRTRRPRRRAGTVRAGDADVEPQDAGIEPDPDERDRRRATTVATSARRRLPTRRSTNGATAISSAPKRPAPIAAQPSTGPSVAPREHGDDGERERPDPDREEPSCQKEIHARVPRRGT